MFSAPNSFEHLAWQSVFILHNKDAKSRNKQIIIPKIILYSLFLTPISLLSGPSL